MATTRTVTREYDAEGRLVREVETTYSTPDYYYQPTQWWQPLPAPYTVTCGGSITASTNDYVTWN